MQFEEFKQALQHTLNHLYDPDHQPAEIIYLGAGCRPDEGVGVLQVAIVQAIAALEPETELPPESRLRRDYDVLNCRYVLGLSQEETGLRMGMSLRNVQRVQREATHLLAQRLWDNVATDSSGVATGAIGWQSQVLEELAWLKTRSSAAGADLREAIDGAMRIARASLEGRVIELANSSQMPSARLGMHPAALRQMILEGIHALARAAPTGHVTLTAEQRGDRVAIAVAAAPAGMVPSLDIAFTRQMLAAQGGTAHTTYDGERVLLALELPAADRSSDRATVLVVDDNADMATLFEAYCAGTRYDIVSLREGQRVVSTIKAHPPDVVLLDVMLPDVDGWDLLMELTRDPTTSLIPIIVCSVVTDERLASTLGAKLYLRKPIYQQQLLVALDRVLSPAPAGG